MWDFNKVIICIGAPQLWLHTEFTSLNWRGCQGLIAACGNTFVSVCATRWFSLSFPYLSLFHAQAHIITTEVACSTDSVVIATQRERVTGPMMVNCTGGHSPLGTDFQDVVCLNEFAKTTFSKSLNVANNIWKRKSHCNGFIKSTNLQSLEVTRLHVET